MQTAPHSSEMPSDSSQKTDNIQENAPQNIENQSEKTMDRREFLKWAAIGSLGLASVAAGNKILGREGSQNNPHASTPTPVELTEPESPFTPEIIKEVPVYGLNEKIGNLNQIENLYKNLDHQYEKKHPEVRIRNKYAQRKELLDPEERYLEVVAFQSTFDSFKERVQETGVDFVEWIKMHVDAMNLCFSDAKPNSNLKAVLRRIVVIDDDTLNPIFDMDAYRKGEAGCGPDVAYHYNFVFNDKCPFDTDECWVVGSDYRVDTKKNRTNNHAGYFWASDSINEKIYFTYPPGGNEKQRVRVYKDKGTNLTGKKGVWMDFGLTHEWLHYLFNLPDEYGYDVHSNGEVKATIATGSFHEPYLSPYLSILSQNQIDNKLRDPNREGNGVGYTILNIPKEVFISTEDNVKIEDIRILRRDETQTYFPDTPDIKPLTQNNLRVSADELIKQNSHAIELNINIDDDKKTLFLPYLAFNMSKMVGKNKSSYYIEVIDKDIDPDLQQHICILDEADIEGQSNELKRLHNLKPIAKMRIDGTNASYIWFQRKT